MSKVHLVCRVMTLCVADPIWGVCRDSYTLGRKKVEISEMKFVLFDRRRDDIHTTGCHRKQECDGAELMIR